MAHLHSFGCLPVGSSIQRLVMSLILIFKVGPLIAKSTIHSFAVEMRVAVSPIALNTSFLHLAIQHNPSTHRLMSASAANLSFASRKIWQFNLQ